MFEVEASGIDIVLAIDTSGSMKALDFEVAGKRHDRLSVIKSVVAEFVEKRASDRMGLVVFGSEAYTASPLTLDHDALLDFLNDTAIGDVGEETAIGSALGTAVKRLKDVPAKSKIVILLTDGTSNAGTLSPVDAAKAAAALGIKIYTIAVGSDDPVPFPVADPMFGGQQIVMQKMPVDEKTLKEIASLAQGKFFKAGDTGTLQKIYDTIDTLEKTEAKIKDVTPYEEAFWPFLLAAFLCLTLEITWGLTRWVRLPQ
jgi:Ca-activated chloride channel family protein